MLYSKGLDQDISQWFDMSSTQRPHEDSSEQQIELDRAVKRILDIVDEEAVIVGADNVILAGISQGCAVAARSLLKVECMIGGFIGLSSWFPEADSEVQAEGSVNEMPIFLAHCQDDGVIAIKYGEELKGQLEGYGFDVEWHRYEDGGHWLNEPKGVGEYCTFLNRFINISLTR
jgi:predicted esterase